MPPEAGLSRTPLGQPERSVREADHEPGIVIPEKNCARCIARQTLPMEASWVCLELSALLTAQKTLSAIQGDGHGGEMEGRGQEGGLEKGQGLWQRRQRYGWRRRRYRWRRWRYRQRRRRGRRGVRKRTVDSYWGLKLPEQSGSELGGHGGGVEAPSLCFGLQSVVDQVGVCGSGGLRRGG